MNARSRIVLNNIYTGPTSNHKKIRTLLNTSKGSWFLTATLNLHARNPFKNFRRCVLLWKKKKQQNDKTRVQRVRDRCRRVDAFSRRRNSKSRVIGYDGISRTRAQSTCRGYDEFSQILQLDWLRKKNRRSRSPIFRSTLDRYRVEFVFDFQTLTRTISIFTARKPRKNVKFSKSVSNWSEIDWKTSKKFYGTCITTEFMIYASF